MDNVLVHHTDWMFFVLLLMVGVLVYLRITFPRRFAQLASIRRQIVMPFDPTYERSPTGALEWALTINYGLALSLLVYVVGYQYGGTSPQSSDIYVYIQILLGIGLYLVIRNLLIRILGYMFDMLRMADWWLKYLHYYRIGIGVWMPLFLFFAVFARWMDYVFTLISVVYLLFFLLRMLYTAGLSIRLQGGIGVMRIILYLCALEIAPLMWLLFWFFG